MGSLNCIPMMSREAPNFTTSDRYIFFPFWFYFVQLFFHSGVFHSVVFSFCCIFVQLFFRSAVFSFSWFFVLLLFCSVVLSLNCFFVQLFFLFCCFFVLLHYRSGSLSLSCIFILIYWQQGFRGEFFMELSTSGLFYPGTAILACRDA